MRSGKDKVNKIIIIQINVVLVQINKYGNKRIPRHPGQNQKQKYISSNITFIQKRNLAFPTNYIVSLINQVQFDALGYRIQKSCLKNVYYHHALKTITYVVATENTGGICHADYRRKLNTYSYKVKFLFPVDNNTM